MFIGVISDTHIPDRAREIPGVIVDEFKKMDMIIHAGDFTEVAVLEKLQSICNNVVGVRGNMDPYEVRSKLPDKQIIKVGNYKIGIMHGYGPSHALVPALEEAFKKETVDLVVFGHSHTPYNEKRAGILYFNPGSPTDKIFAPFNSYGIIEVGEKEISGKIVKI